jgi:hypothetical protein
LVHFLHLERKQKQQTHMSKWKKINGVDMDDLRSARKSLHIVVQLVSLLPRNLLPHDPTDGTASLEWNKSNKSLESINVSNEVGLPVRVGLSFKKFELYIGGSGGIIAALEMRGKTALEAFEWLKTELGKLDFNSDKLTLNLPYELAEFDTSKTLEIKTKSNKEYTRLYGNTFRVLKKLIPSWENAFEIRCWPHHFDLARIIPLETDAEGESTKSIGIGLSPGDETIDEPYLYINVWPQLEWELLNKHPLPSGHWNKTSWSGAIFTYTELIAMPDQGKSFERFIKTAISAIENELK